MSTIQVRLVAGALERLIVTLQEAQAKSPSGEIVLDIVEHANSVEIAPSTLKVFRAEGVKVGV